MSLKLTWVNHASFILSDDKVALISDPWLEGTAFNDGWKLLTPTVLAYDGFKSITHIWFSHEHPDHFAPMVIKKIPAEYRQNITVLYQSTIDRKVAEFCAKQGFKAVVEIGPDDKIKLSPSMVVSCQKVKNETDSWMLIETPDMRILNLNDCHFQLKRSSVDKLKQIVGEIDMLLTQFSYAQWVGNHDQPEMHRKLAKEQLDEMKLQIDVLKPRIVVPFASYVWFCHEENFFMNAEVNKIRDVYNILSKWDGITPFVFYPGDVWDMAEPWKESEQAISRYEADYNRIISEPSLIKTKSIPLDVLQKAAEDYKQRSFKDNNVKKLLAFEPFTFYLTDQNMVMQFSYKNGMENAAVEKGHADVSLSSDALLYCFKFDWGFSTLYVSGRFEKPIHGNFNKVEQYQWVSNLKNIGKGVPYLPERVWTRLKQLMTSD